MNISALHRSLSSSTLPDYPPHLSSSSQAFVRSASHISAHHNLAKLPTSHHRIGPVCALDSHGSDGAAKPGELSALDRRQLLLASSSLSIAGALPSLLLPNSAHGDPVQPPDFKLCTTPIDPGNDAPSVDCCLPVSTTITDFTLPTNLPMRTRLSAHQVPASYIDKYTKAYQLLRELPDSDPRQYAQQANVHCAFCDAAYDQNGTEIEYQVHNSWLFFPWHRWYLYFHERILASLINDNTFALPFWNWDSESGYTIPPIYDDSTSSLYSVNRNPAHRPPTLVDLNYNFTESTLTPAEQLATNNTVMYRQLVTNSKTPSLFFGQAYRQGDEASPGGGTVESIPHGTVHVWTGNPSNPNDEDMGTLYSAGRDPIFFAHHSNVDRLWEVWKGLGGRRKDLTDPDYLNATFLFYDENAKLVRVRVGDALDPSKLSYKYQAVPNGWLTAAPKARTSSDTAMSFGPGGGPSPAMAGSFKEKLKAKYKDFKSDLKEFKERGSKKVEKSVKALVKRPKKVRADDYDEEILVLEGVQIASNDKVKFDVYINLVDADEETVGSDVPEYAGSFVNVPHMGMTMGEGMKMGAGAKLRKSNVRLGIGEVLKDLEIEDDDDFAITIVPRGKPNVAISIDNVRIEYE